MDDVGCTIKVVCARCGSRLARAYSGLRCPRLDACGYGGLVEDVAAARRFRVRRELEAPMATGPRRRAFA